MEHSNAVLTAKIAECEKLAATAGDPLATAAYLAMKAEFESRLADLSERIVYSQAARQPVARNWMSVPQNAITQN